MTNRVARKSKRRAEKPQPKKKRKPIAIVCTLLILTLAVGVMAQWKILPGTSKPLAIAVAPQASFNANNPSKEYIYAGGRLIATEEPAASTGQALTAQNVFWTNVTGVTASGNSLSRPTGIGWNAGAISTQTINSGDCYAEFTATETNTSRMFGLGNGDLNQSDSDIEFAFEINAAGQIIVWESGTSRGVVGSYVASDRLRISVESGLVKYRKNGNIIHTSGVAPSYPLAVDTSLYSTNSTITDAVIAGNFQSAPATSDVVWTNLVGASATGNTLTKTASTYAWDTGAVSTKAIASGDGYLEFTATETNTARMCGLGQGDTNQGYADIDYAIFLGEDGVIYLYEFGVYRGSFGTYDAGDKFRVSIEGGAVKYRRKGNLLYSSTIAPTYPLLVDTSLNFPNATISNAVLSGTLTP
jgi:hypothetical protein